MEILTTIIGKIAEDTVVTVGRQVGYLIHYKSNHENLKSQLMRLEAAKDRMEHMVDEVTRKGRRIETDVRNWQIEVDEIIQVAVAFLEDEYHAKSKCLHGICPNPISYHRLSRKSTKLMMHIAELYENRDFASVYDATHERLSSVFDNAAQKDICSIPSEEYMSFESRISMVKNILVELRNPDTDMIGVYGLRGVGKTTLAKEVFRQAIEGKLFDDVIIVLDVARYSELEIQMEISEKLGMDINESQAIEVRARYLCNRTKDKKILVILDDVSQRIDLEAIGLLLGVHCNILLTSRSREVLSSQMRTEKEFRLEVLGEEESWSLFEKMAGDVIKDDCIRKVAIQVAKKCGGLPDLVVKVASSLRSDGTLEEWEVALRHFKVFNKKGYIGATYLAIEKSYNKLENEELKALFLLSGIIAGGSCTIYLTDLLKYAIGLGLPEYADSVEEAMDAMFSLAIKLGDYCLLLDNFGDGTVRMHELVRDVAIWIASKDKHAFSRADGDELKVWPSSDILKKCSAISLKSCKIPKFPEAPWPCPELKTFILENDGVDDSLEIPGNFFKGMTELKVLAVKRLCISALSPSLRFLTNLQTLCLDLCILGDIALVGQLKNLRVLSLMGSKLKELPKQIGQLTCLQLLDLSNCSELVVIPPNVISSLTRLEDLRMGINSFKQWEGEGFIHGRSNASLSELKQLYQLTALEIHIPDASILPANLFSDKLKRYNIVIGDCWASCPDDLYETSTNMLKLKLATINQFDQVMKLLLTRCEHLSLDGMGLESVCSGKLLANPFQNLQSLTLCNLPKLIGSSSKGSMSIVTSRTDKQLAIDTEAQEIILENEVGRPTKLFMNGEVVMPNLTRFILHQCDGVRFLFSCSMATSLVQLQHLEISNCQNMEEIVSKDDYKEEIARNMFRRLKHLQLQNLPSLARFCSGSFIEFPSLGLLHVEDCPKMGTSIFEAKSGSITINKENGERDSKENLETQYFLFDEKVGFPSLERLIISDLPKLMTIWHYQLSQDSYSRLKKIEVLRCQSLINIFASSMSGRLDALDTLQIWQCQSLQVVFEAIDVKETSEPPTTQFKSFECPNLESVVIHSCQSLKSIFSPSVARNLHQLRELKVGNCGVEVIVSKEELEMIPDFLFPKVTSVTFQNLPQLRSFYPGLHLSKWSLLKELAFFECGNVEVFASKFSRFYEKHEFGVRSPIKQPFFLIEKGNSFPNLEDLSLDGKTEIWYEVFGPLPADLFSKLKYLSFSGEHPKLVVFLQKLHNLEQLIISSGSGKEIFVSKGNSSWGIHAVTMTLPNVKLLCLRKMDQLIHLGKNSQPVVPVLENLEILKVYECGKLKNLSSSGISFRNLTTLDVWGCDGLRYLTTYLVAKSLQQLKDLKVEYCEKLTEIVATSGDESENEIALSGVEHLKLSHLPSLQGFCSGNCIVKVPSLGTLMVNDCMVKFEISPDGLLISDSRPKTLK